MARERAPRKDLFLYAPESLLLITDKEHPLYDPRVELPPDESMIANIAMHGVLEPILVRRNGAAIEVIAGRGRTKAAMEANKRLIAEGKPPLLVPVVFKSGADADLFGILIAENEIRRNDGMIEKGEKARKLHNMGYTVQQIALTFGATRQAVENWLEVQQMPELLKQAVEAGEVSATAALQLSGLPRDEQVKRYEAMKQQGAKPTTQNVRSAAASPDNAPAPKMKTRREIEAELKNRASPYDEYQDGYIAALLWVLGQDCGVSA
jgi:ParB family chromosome partitioning protein